MKIIVLALAVTWVTAGGAAPRVPDRISRFEALRHDFGTQQEIVQVRVDFPSGTHFPMHTHPGVEVAYVLEGSLVYTFEDKPPVTLQPGQALFIPAGQPHAAGNEGATAAAELATYVVKKGVPIVVLRGGNT